jgi:alkanesulfonate monooxygenase SsuD/methylene tetrahydromethanopterin reductase-like flavin-dependent oxidoreductase (luciferase family)
LRSHVPVGPPRFGVVIRPDFTPESIGPLARLAEVQLRWLSSRKIPVLVGGAGAKTLRLASHVADGVVLDCQHTPTTVRAALHEANYDQDGARDGFSSVLYLACAPGEGGKVSLRAEADKWNVASAGEFGVGGDTDDIRDGIRTYLDAGVKTLVLQSVGGEERHA